MACQDFGRVTASMPIEAQIFEVGIYALAFEQVSDAQAQGAANSQTGYQNLSGYTHGQPQKAKEAGTGCAVAGKGRRNAANELQARSAANANRNTSKEVMPALGLSII